MEDFNSILKRMDIQQVCTFLLTGEDDPETDSRSYEHRIKEKDVIMRKKIEEVYPDGDDRDGLFVAICEALVTREKVFLEIGMKAGAKMMIQFIAGNP